MRRWRSQPSSFVREVFKVEPDIWQAEVLDAFPTHPKQAMTACKGPGKTTVLAWIGWNFLFTRVNARCAALSITADTLRDTLWAEFGKWYAKAPLLQAYFTVEGERISSKEQPKTWWLSARSYPRSANPADQATALQGLHEDNALILIDEAGGVPRSVLATAEAVLTGGKDQHIVLAGNPNNQNSALGHAAVTQRANWWTMEITGDPDDPKRASRVDPKWCREQIESWGRDNPWVLVNVFGKFPPGGLNTLLTPDEVLSAQRRAPKELDFAEFPLIIGVDVARFGDDEIVFFPRRGKIAYPPLRMRNLDTIFLASHLSRVATERKADSIQIDVSGSAGVYDCVRNFGHHEALPVEFGGKAYQDKRFKNKRAEIWWLMAQDIKEGLALPRVDEMVNGLSTVTYSYDPQGRIQIEDKQLIKDRIGRSPDLEDALACTYAHPVVIQHRTLSGLPASLSHAIETSLHQRDYDPFERFAQEQKREHG